MTRQASTQRRDLLLCLLLIAGTVAVFGRVYHQEFLNYDDQIYVYQNPAVCAGLNAANLRWAFCSPHIGHYHPLTWLSYMLDVSLFGVRPGPMKFTSLLLHLLNTVLLFLALKRMTGAPWRSTMVAALFAVHPLHVEPVAWIASRKDVLSGLFFMLTLLSYAWYTERPSPRRYLTVLLCFVLGLLSKPMLMTLPFVLLLLDYWPLRRLGRNTPISLRAYTGPDGDSHGEEASEKSPFEGGFRGMWAPGRHSETTVSLRALWPLIREKLPLFALTGLSCAATIYAGTVHNVFPDKALYPLSVRLPNAAVSYARHLLQTVWPVRLAVHYPHPGASLPHWQLAAALVVLAVITVVVLLGWRRWPYAPVGWFWYLGTLVPVIGIIQFGGHASADRYTYLPLIGIFIAVTWAVAERWASHPRVLVGLAGAVLLALMTCAWIQVGYWQNSETLCRHALRVTTNNVRMHNNLGNTLRDQGRIDEAITQFSSAANVPGPFQVNPHLNLGTLLLEQGRIEDAAMHFLLVLQNDPGCEPAHYFLGKIRAAQNRNDEAIAEYNQALLLSPGNPETRQALGALTGGAELDQRAAHNALGKAYFAAGKLEPALRHYQEALRIAPEDPETHYNLALALIAGQQLEAAAEHLLRVVNAQPDNADALTNLGTLFAMTGKTPEAIARFQQALEHAPNHLTAHYNLAQALAEQGRIEEAAQHFAAVLRIDPTHQGARAALDRIQAAGTP